MTNDITSDFNEEEINLLNVKDRISIYKEYLEIQSEQAQKYLEFIKNLDELYKRENEKNNLSSNKEKLGFEIIMDHSGKRMVYETYLKDNPKMAQKYFEFIAKNSSIPYPKWNEKKQDFTA